MALIDDEEFTVVTTNWALLLDGAGIIANVENESAKNIDLRYDSKLPVGELGSRKLFNGTEWENKHFDSKVYGKATNGVVRVLITREVK